MKLLKVLFVTTVVFTTVFLFSCASTDVEKKEFKKVDTPVTITFPSQDGIPVTADCYMAYDKSATLILLCHRAKWSRGEYLEIAPKLNLLGFNAIAIDQRSGKTKNEIDNATEQAATATGKGTTYLDAIQDIQSAIDYVFKNYATKKIILWGSSYSSSLGFTLIKSNADKISAYLAFSPGEYFVDLGKPANWIATEAKDVKQPVLIVTRPSEQKDAQPIFDAILNKDKVLYLPTYESKHGSQSLYEATEHNQETWSQVKKFLSRFAD